MKNTGFRDTKKYLAFLFLGNTIFTIIEIVFIKEVLDLTGEQAILIWIVYRKISEGVGEWKRLKPMGLIQ
jgi:hypothetical protein